MELLDIERRWELAEQSCDRGDYAGAVHVLNSLARDGEWLAYVELGNIFEQGGGGIERDTETALKWYRRAVLDADDANAHVALARIAFIGDIPGMGSEESIRHCKKALSMPPPFNPTLENQILAFLILGKIQESRSSTSSYIENAKDMYLDAAKLGSVVGMRLLGRLEWRSGHFFRGLSLILRAAYMGLRISLSNSNDPRLVGIEGFHLGTSARSVLMRAARQRKNAPKRDVPAQ